MSHCLRESGWVWRININIIVSYISTNEWLLGKGHMMDFHQVIPKSVRFGVHWDNSSPTTTLFCAPEWSAVVWRLRLRLRWLNVVGRTYEDIHWRVWCCKSTCSFMFMFYMIFSYIIMIQYDSIFKSMHVYSMSPWWSFGLTQLIPAQRLTTTFQRKIFIYFASIYTYTMIYANLCRFETHNWNHFRFISCYCSPKKHPLKHPNPFQVAIFIKRFENLFEGFQLIFNVLLHEVDEFTFLQVRKSSVLRRPRVVPFLHQCGCHSDEE